MSKLQVFSSRNWSVIFLEVTPFLPQKEKVKDELNQRILGNSSCLKSFLSTTPQLLPFGSLICNINKISYPPKYERFLHFSGKKQDVML